MKKEDGNCQSKVCFGIMRTWTGCSYLVEAEGEGSELWIWKALVPLPSITGNCSLFNWYLITLILATCVPGRLDAGREDSDFLF